MILITLFFILYHWNCNMTFCYDKMNNEQRKHVYQLFIIIVRSNFLISRASACLLLTTHIRRVRLLKFTKFKFKHLQNATNRKLR